MSNGTKWNDFYMLELLQFWQRWKIISWEICFITRISVDCSRFIIQTLLAIIQKILCFYSSFPLYYFLQGQKCVNKKEGPSFFLKGITFLCRLLNSKPESCNKEHAFFTCQVGDSMAEDDFLSKNRYKF